LHPTSLRERPSFQGSLYKLVLALS
jgi:hypothetical protein